MEDKKGEENQWIQGGGGGESFILQKMNETLSYGWI
jgi:hypothetical protein